MEVVTEETTTKRVTEGYKRTEVGVIPKDWKVVKIGDFLSFKNGLNKAKRYFGSGTPIVNYMDVFKHSGLFRDDLEGKVTLSNKEIRRYEVKKGDVFFTRTSETVEEVGISAVMLEEVEDTVFSGFVLRGRPIDSVTDLYFRKYCFDSEIVRRQIQSSATHTTRALTNGGSLSKVLLPLPPSHEEQQAIAKALSDVDALIAELDALIEKKQQVKKGTMQQLLTGKKRLPGFDGEWEEKKLGELSNMTSGGTPLRSNSNYFGGEYPWLVISDISKAGKYISITEDTLSEKGLRNSSAKLFPKNTLFFAMYASIGKCTISKTPMTSNQAILGINVSGAFLEYIYYYLSFNKIKYQNMGQTGTQSNLNKEMVQNLDMMCPPIEEQKAIAGILSDLDTEIQALQSKRSKYEKIKQGMMQQLLTGRIRIYGMNGL